MSDPTDSPTTISNIGVAMFTIADQDAAIAYYTQTLGWELRADVPFGDEGGNRWVEVAPPGSGARLALNPPMGGQPGGSAIGVETPDVDAERARFRFAAQRECVPAALLSRPLRARAAVIATVDTHGRRRV